MSDANSSDDMTSFEVLHTTHNGPPESIDSADFIFMPERPAQPITRPTDGHLLNNFDMTNMQSAFMSATPDLSTEEIQKRLIELLEENETMKEALKKNNGIMQEQLSTISAWHEQMSLSKSKQRACLEKANEKVSVLENQNKDLMQQIQDLQNKFPTASETAETCSRYKILETESKRLSEENSLLLKEKNDLRRDLKLEKDFRSQLEQNILSISNYLDNLQSGSKLLEAEKKELTALNNELQLKLAALDTQFNTIISTDEEIGYEIVHQKQLKEESVKESLLHLSASQDEKNELKKIIDEQNVEIESLKKHAEDLSEKISVYEQKQREYETASKSKFEVSQNELDLASSLIEKYKERCENLQLQFDECQTEVAKVKNSTGHTIQQLQEEIQKLKEVVDLCQRCKENDRCLLSETKTELEKLKAEYNSVTEVLKLKSKEEIEQAEQFDTAREKEAKNHLEQIDTFTARLLDMEQKLEERDEKVKELTSELNTVKQDAEAIPILKAQVEVYKTDLHNAVCARDSAHEEVERLTNEVKKLQATASSSGNSELSSPGTKHSGKSKAQHRRVDRGSDITSLGGFTCPVCNFTFTDIQSAQNHVNRCLDELSH